MNYNIHSTNKKSITINTTNNLKHNYKFFPKNIDELKQIIDAQINKYGLEVDLNNIDVSQITDMSYLFHASKFNGNISKWDVSNVKNMFSMFSNSVFNGDISNWNVHNVRHMSWMFKQSKFNQDISNWDISNVSRFNEMFNRSKFNQDISRWFIKLNNKCKLSYFGEFNNINIHSYNDFKKYHRKIILKKLIGNINEV